MGLRHAGTREGFTPRVQVHLLVPHVADPLVNLSRSCVCRASDRGARGVLLRLQLAAVGTSCSSLGGTARRSAEDISGGFCRGAAVSLVTVGLLPLCTVWQLSASSLVDVSSVPPVVEQRNVPRIASQPRNAELNVDIPVRGTQMVEPREEVSTARRCRSSKSTGSDAASSTTLEEAQSSGKVFSALSPG